MGTTGKNSEHSEWEEKTPGQGLLYPGLKYLANSLATS
jgi:hypothetical protein